MFLQIVHFFSEYFFQEQTCVDQNEVPIELHGERSMDIHHVHELHVVV